jgi:hypothetical protein
MMLRRIFGPKRNELTWEWRKLQNEELNILHSSPNIIPVITQRKLRWAGHVARMGEKRVTYRILEGKPEGETHLQDPSISIRIILKLILGK